jgi:hypothetical protein
MSSPFVSRFERGTWYLNATCFCVSVAPVSQWDASYALPDEQVRGKSEGVAQNPVVIGSKIAWFEDRQCNPL